MKTAASEAAENIIPLPSETTSKGKAQPLPSAFKSRFRIIPFENRGGSTSWRVTGIKRDGTRIRENCQDEDFAKKRQAQLELEYLAREDNPETAAAVVRTTKLTDHQLRICETALARLDNDDELTLAVSHWLTHGRPVAVAESPRLDDATKRFFEWIETTETLRPRTKGKLKNRVKMFRDGVPNMRVADIGPEVIESFFSKRTVSALTKVGDREAISRFFSWCMARPREWAKVNPCGVVKIERRKDGKSVAILTVEECRKILEKAESHRRGRLAPYIAVCLFGALRPTEAQRLTWDKVNLADGEIRIEAQSSKRKEARVITMGKTLAAWLKRYKNKPFKPANLRRDLEVVKRAAGYTGRMDEKTKDLKPWPADVLRHTGISHYFRQTGSYGLTAEMAGNSESVIRKFYQGRVSSEDTKAFYAILPKKAKR